MTAQDNLNPQQFMDVKTLGNYESMDFPGKTMNQVHTMFKARERKSIDFRNQMTDLRGDIEDHGISQPLAIDSSGWTNETHGATPMLGDGHHRFSAAKSLRMKTVPVHEVMGADDARHRIEQRGMPTDVDKYGP